MKTNTIVILLIILISLPCMVSAQGLTHLSTTYLGATAEAIAIYGGRAYIALGESGIEAYDVLSPQNPEYLGAFDTPGYAAGLYIAYPFVHVADGDSGVTIIDYGNAENPLYVGSYGTPGYANDLIVSCGISFVADGDSGLHATLIINPEEPEFLESLQTPGYASRITGTCGGMYLADGNGGFHHYIADGLDLIHLSSLDDFGYINSVFGVSGYAYIADSVNGISIGDMGDPENIIILSHRQTPGNAVDIAIWDGFIYVADGEMGISIIDVRDVYNPELAINDNSIGYIKSLAVWNEYIYAISGDSFHIFRFSPTGFSDENSSPVDFELETSNYPNPFNASTRILFSNLEPGIAEITIYNNSGQVVDNIFHHENKSSGGSVVWDASRFASGVYFYRLTSGDFSIVKPMSLIK
ncbi:MAG: T9SS type A sorting domain-containing protein [candidate division Zixibacteria bacterium]|nr:T9SS type A sorting domain-containing protein [candidate division Zixibacteria bacterium]